MAIIQPSAELTQAIRNYKAGDQQAFERIYSLSAPYLSKCIYNVISRTAGASDELLQDILQDTFLTVAEKLDTLQNEQAYFQWAGQIATNHALRTWKKENHRQEMEQSEEDMLYDLPDDQFIPEDILENKQKQQMIRDMLRSLPTAQYLCVVEYFYNGLKEAEIAEKLDMPLGTVKTNIFRAKKKMRELIGTHEKKHGVKLYSMSAVLVLLLWRESSKAPAVAAAAAPATLGAVKTVAAKTAATTVAKKAAVGIGAKLSTKIAAGVTAATLVAGGTGAAIWAGSQENAPPVYIPPTTVTEAALPIPEDAFVFNGHSYYLVETDSESWEDAKAHCEAQGGYLAVITSEEENAALYGYLQSQDQNSAYFGLYRNLETDAWEWVNGEPLIYENWAESEPNNYDGLENYGMFYFKYPGGRWNDGGYGTHDTEDTQLFLCEWDATP